MAPGGWCLHAAAVTAFTFLVQHTGVPSRERPADTTAVARSQPSLQPVDRIRIAEAFALEQAIGKELWDGWEGPPSALLLVTHEGEFLIRHPDPSPDFTFLHHDSLLQADIYVRPRQYPTNLLATFPAVNRYATIVIGQAESTQAKTSTAWVLTLMHEHFHQMQMSDPTYYDGVRGLDLSKGDHSGMWMLNYKFPYDSKSIDNDFRLLSRGLRDAVRSSGDPVFTIKLARYLELRTAFTSMLSPDDLRYFSFQVWQEGIAHYTELRIAEIAAEQYTPSEEFQGLKDFTPFRQEARRLRSAVLRSLWNLSLNASGRTAFYAFGAAEGLLLDIVNSRWRARYFKEKFSIERFFSP